MSKKDEGFRVLPIPFATDKQLECYNKARDYAKKRSGVPVEELPQHGKWRWRSLISLLLLLAAFGLVLVGSYFLLR